MSKFNDAIGKMDKWAPDDLETMDEFYDIVDDENLSTSKKVEQVTDMIDNGMLVQDMDRLNDIIGEEWESEELAAELVNQNC